MGRSVVFAHLATLVKQLVAPRPGALLLDGGDTWWVRHGTVDARPGTWWMPANCWVSTSRPDTGSSRSAPSVCRQIIDQDFAGMDFVAHNVKP